MLMRQERNHKSANTLEDCYSQNIQGDTLGSSQVPTACWHQNTKTQLFGAGIAPLPRMRFRGTFRETRPQIRKCRRNQKPAKSCTCSLWSRMDFNPGTQCTFYNLNLLVLHDGVGGESQAELDVGNLLREELLWHPLLLHQGQPVLEKLMAWVVSLKPTRVKMRLESDVMT